MNRYVCPACRTVVGRTGAVFECSRCRRTFPIILGIPDFRMFGESPNFDPRVYEARLVPVYEQKGTLASSAELYELYLHVVGEIEGWSGDRTAYCRDHMVRIVEDFDSKPARILRHLEERGVAAGRVSPSADSVALDLGCGFGGTVKGLATRFRHVVGIDINLGQLVVTKKLLEERHVPNVTLLAACAEALPFGRGAFGLITILDVIEHVNDQRAILREARRVLSEAGALALMSPNRFTLGPEQHTGCGEWGFCRGAPWTGTSGW